MWWTKQKDRAEHQAHTEALVALDTERVDAIIAKIESQEKEVSERVLRLQRREYKNNFGEALTLAMERRAIQ